MPENKKEERKNLKLKASRLKRIALEDYFFCLKLAIINKIAKSSFVAILYTGLVCVECIYILMLNYYSIWK